ncbi:acyltransferase [Mucilaginibacter sp. PPCGB 2223]|uniref:MBOAT family O-acyltransferase n=1 Tax=Mucilaginibacter sp. PPCGB 2223 TaxID=1886027 RepID=UPI0008270FFF|nr:MBOAT family O-acyltransferase [Mucilaginibacter sp. PPCGB 2223]OCX53859.1 acyltransferase [Mucilaginibacter sp. PPCGB 2223]
MLFNSFAFIILVLVTFLIYYLPFLSKFQIQILIISSLIFYAYGQPYLLVLLLLSAAINIVTSYLVVNQDRKYRRVYATLGVCINVLILVFFKYSPLFAKTFFNTATDPGRYLLLIPLPIGISFYTFEGISLLIDVYSNKHHDVLTIDKSFKKHIYKTLFFISFFPHLIAGPILKAYEFYPQIGPKKLTDIDWAYVFKKLITGYFLKMTVADNLSNFTFWMEYPYFKTLSSVELIAMVFGYSFQIFADFAGYSLIALGIAKMFGYDLMENFNFPYISASFSDFWRRWHISLSTFLKEYLYIPLGGNRSGKVRTYINLIITMTLGGLWHGAAWSYAVWGLFHGGALAVERFFTRGRNDTEPGIWQSFLKRVVVFLFVTFAWILFKLPFAHVIEYFSSIFANYKVSITFNNPFLIIIYSLPVILYHLYYLGKSNTAIAGFFTKYQFVVYGLMLFMIIVNSGPSGSFIYFQF